MADLPIPRKDQVAFAEEILKMSQKTQDVEMLEGLLNLTSLFVVWIGDGGETGNGLAVDLNEYAYEQLAVAKGQQDTGWRDYHQKEIKEEIDFFKSL